MLDIIVNPFITVLLFLYDMLGGNVVLAIVVFTVLVRLATYPLTLKQQRSTKAMQALQPELKKIQEKYKNDREKAAQAQWELYRQYGFNPMASCLPLLVQLPIMIGLYRAIVATLAATPLELLDLSQRLWVSDLSNLVPLENQFLWLNLAVPDPLYVLPILVVITTWLQQKLIMPPAPKSSGGDKAADQTAAITRQMTTIMPLMFGVFAISFASGLSIYFIASNLIGIVQYGLTGRIDFRRLLGREPEDAPETMVVAGKAKHSQVIEETAALEKPKRTTEPTLKPKRSGISDTRAQRTKAKSKAKG
ncbi:MAG: YidC/Oxa1 family membrane protein insertase [Chloroflexi bacterium]|nr:YidC/Oxa1 family membrane protein insertase [Chloroflexota bacterium]